MNCLAQAHFVCEQCAPIGEHPGKPFLLERTQRTLSTSKSVKSMFITLCFANTE
jgi:hypothetical protein